MKRVDSNPCLPDLGKPPKKLCTPMEHQRLLLEVFEFIAIELKKESELAAWGQVSSLFHKKVKFLQTQDAEIISKYNIFGRREWQKAMKVPGKPYQQVLTKIKIKIGDALRIPQGTTQIMESPCPFWKGKKIHETHMMTLMPKTINGKPLTLLNLDESLQNFSCEFFNPDEHGNTPTDASYWLLMPYTVTKESRNKSLIEQCKLIELTNQKTGHLYSLPSCIEAKVSILMHLFITGKTSYKGAPLGKRSTYTRCQEIAHQTIYNTTAPERWHLAVGGIEVNTLIIRETDYDDEDYGVAPVLRFK